MLKLASVTVDTISGLVELLASLCFVVRFNHFFVSELRTAMSEDALVTPMAIPCDPFSANLGLVVGFVFEFILREWLVRINHLSGIHNFHLSFPESGTMLRYDTLGLIMVK